MMKQAVAAPPKAGGRVLSLDMIKGLCIVMVILTHVPLTNEVKKAIFYPFTILPAVPMFLMCSIYAFSLTEDRKNGDIFTWFSSRTFWRRANRFLFPFLFSVGIIIAGLVLLSNLRRLAFASFFKLVFLGGRGPGGYYVLILFQLLVLFPFLRHFFCLNQIGTTLGLMAVHICYETLCKMWGMNERVYNILIFRFLTHLALGFLLYYYHERMKGTALPAVAMIVRALYIIAAYYFGYRENLSYIPSMRSIFPAFYAFGALCYLLRTEAWLQKAGGWIKPVLYIGKASFHIMLVQMVYFYFARKLAFEGRFHSLLVVTAVDLAISLAAGCLFYWMDCRLRMILKK